MKKICLGLKFRSDDVALIDELPEEVRKIVDYFELLVVPGHVDDVLKLPRSDYIIHAPHSNLGVNIGDPSKRNFNLEMIDVSLQIARRFHSPYVILHAEYGSREAAEDILSSIELDRVILENMPKAGIHGGDCLYYDPHDFAVLLDRFNIGFCLDFGHAYKASISMRRPYMEVIGSFLDLKPAMFHLSDGDTNKEVDDHKSLGDGNFDLEYIAKCLLSMDRPRVTLETPRRNGLAEDIKNVEYVANIFGNGSKI
ncbi:MAG: TIM barrel protein [Candidatus Altiarchaeota archaeon]|nr:TIM barrel protein [Candidatus Altiarchaeota archaeon]